MYCLVYQEYHGDLHRAFLTSQGINKTLITARKPMINIKRFVGKRSPKGIRLFAIEMYLALFSFLTNCIVSHVDTISPLVAT